MICQSEVNEELSKKESRVYDRGEEKRREERKKTKQSEGISIKRKHATLFLPNLCYARSSFFVPVFE